MFESGAPEVVCIGNICLDLPLRYVDESVFRTDSFVIDRIWPVLGGSAANVATILTKLGKNIRLIAPIGDDRLGDLIEDYCAENRVDSAHLVRKAGVNTSLNVGLVREDGERFFVVSKTSSTFAFTIDDIDLSVLDGAKILAFSSIFINPRLDSAALTTLFKTAKKKKLIVCADMMRSRDGKVMEDIAECLSYIDYFFANTAEVLHLTGQTDVEAACTKLISAGVSTVVVKKGGMGSVTVDQSGMRSYPAFAATKPVDTIGAGDNFLAGFLHGLIENAPLSDCIKIASAVASLSVRGAGATSGVQSKDQLSEFMASESIHGW